MSESVWKYFVKEGKDQAKCLKCPNKVLSCKGSSTSGLIRHLDAIHKINLQKRRQLFDSDGSSGSQNKDENLNTSHNSVLKFVQRKSMAEIVARLVASDHGICKSEFIRQSLKDRQYNLPKDKTNIMKLVHSYYETAKSNVMKKIRNHTSIDGRFSLTLDEWTSMRNRRYLNVNLHFNKQHINLGLQRIAGSCNAEKTVDLLKEVKLRDFEIKSSDVVSSTTDGAAVMIKFGKLSGFEHQLCYNHGIHLAVLDVIYKKQLTAIQCDEDDDKENYIDTDENDSDLESLDQDMDEQFTDYSTFNNITIALSLQMVRNIVKFFKRSPVKNTILQEHVMQQHGKELNLCLDCKTRWNSMETMLERFLKIVDSIRKALQDLNSKLLNENNLLVLKDLLDAIKPIKLAIEALG